MRAEDRIIRDAKIEDMHKRGVPKSEISRSLGVKPNRIYEILAQRGAISVNPADRVERTIWDGDSRDRLRQAIHRRQVAGARAALQMMRQQ